MILRPNRRGTYAYLGLDTKSSYMGYHTLNEDDSFNIRKKNVSYLERVNIFHTMVTMSWPKFFAVLAIVYFGINILFASLYVLIGTENFTGIQVTTRSCHHFLCKLMCFQIGF